MRSEHEARAGLPLAAAAWLGLAFMHLPILIMIVYLLIARRLGAFEHV